MSVVDEHARSITHPCDDRLTDHSGPNQVLRVELGPQEEGFLEPMQGLQELPRRGLAERSLVPASHGHSRTNLADSEPISICIFGHPPVGQDDVRPGELGRRGWVFALFPQRCESGKKLDS